MTQFVFSMHGTPRLSSVAYCILITLLLGATVAVAQPSATDPICSLPQLQCTSSTTPGNNGDYTWCSKQNVFMNPLQFELPGNVSASFPAPQCAGSSSSALCSAISQVSTAAWRDFSGTTHNLVLVGLQDGAWTVFDFNAESILGKWDAGNHQPLIYLRGHFAQFLGTVVTGDTDQLVLWTAQFPSTELTLALAEPWFTEPHQGLVLSIDSQFVSFSESYQLLLALTYLNTTDNSFVYQIRQYIYANSAVTKGNVTTWTIDTAGDNPIWIQAKFVTHTGFGQATISPSHPSCTPVNDTRQLVALFSTRAVALYRFDASGHVLNGTFTLQFSANAPSSTVFVAPTSALITDIEVVHECFQRDSNPSSGLWLVAGTMTAQNSSDNALHVIQLAEFGMHDFTCETAISDADLSAGLVMTRVNDACQQLLPSKCHVDEWYNGVTCQSRAHYEQALLIQPNMLQVRFLDEPQGSVTWQDYSVNGTSSTLLREFNYHVIFISNGLQSVHVLGMQEVLCSASAMTITWLNEIDLPNQIAMFAVSNNAQHVFVVTNLEHWQIDSQNRLLEICATLAVNKSNELVALLQPYQPLCQYPLGPPKPFDFSDFMFFMSMCNSGTYCPSLDVDFIGSVAPGNYTYLPGKVAPCPPRFYCPNGKIKVCPSGYICPDTGMISPEKCEAVSDKNITCYQQGLDAPQDCPAGFICLVPNVEPVPVAPGLYLPQSRPLPPGTPCPAGSYCPLGVSAPPALCPAGLYCSSPGVMLPEVCPTAFDSKGNKLRNFTTYCPEGTVTPQLCPAGYYCLTPLNKTACDQGQYCPNGTQLAENCPAGYLCATPDDKQLCPRGSYCPDGTYQAKKCSPFDYCPAGSASNHRWAALLFDMVLVLLVVASYKLYTHLRDKRQKSRMEMQRQGKKDRPNRFVINSHVPEDSPLLDTADIASLAHRLPALSQSRYKMLLEIEFRDIQLAKNGKNILKGVSGGFYPGRLSAIMGPSGAGKSSLMSVLSGRTAKTGGHMYINGQEARDLSQYKTVMGFVPQDDIMHRKLTVKEIFKFNADARLPVNLSEPDKESLINDIIEVLGLFNVKHSVIGDEETRGLSGGERKRVNIGMELASDPLVLFLDEPTSGLDSTAATEVVKCLQTIARVGNITVVCVIHQPRYEVFKLFDDVLFLAPGGSTVYHGPVDKSQQYFETMGFKVPPAVNPADFYLDVISRKVDAREELLGIDFAGEWERHKKGYQVPTDVDAPDTAPFSRRRLPVASDKIPTRKTAGFFRQLGLFIARTFILETRDLPNVFLNLTLVFIAGLLLGFVYNDSQYIGPATEQEQAQCPSFIRSVCGMARNDEYVIMFSLLNMAMGLTAIAGSLKVFGEERVTYWRESTTGINSLAFFLGKNLSTLQMVLLPPFVFLSIFYLLISPRSNFWYMYAIMIGTQYACTGAGHLISLVFVPQNALLAGVSYEVVATMFAGGNPTLTKIYSYGLIGKALASISYSRWATEGLYVTELHQYAEEYNVQPSLDYWGYELNAFNLDVAMLFTIGTVLRIGSFIALIALHKNRQT